MSKYDTALTAMAARHVTVASEPISVTITAAAARKLGHGRPYIRWESQVMGICRACQTLPIASDATPMAEVRISAPETDAERDALVLAIVQHLTQSPGIGGSQYDPAFRAEWAEYRRVMAELRA